MLAVFWIVPAGATFGQSAISFTTGSDQVLLPPVPPIVVFASPPALGGSSVSPTLLAAVPPIQQQRQPITVRAWDNQAGPISSWDVRIDAPFFDLPHPPFAFPDPVYLVLDFETMLRLSGQSDSMSANPVPEPGSLLLLVAAGLGLFAAGQPKFRGRRTRRRTSTTSSGLLN